ncbi:TIGR02221 family CRISPR-associated protein [Rhodothermus marinus]|uniref:CRISPR-associated protein, TM1812 family n=1 Tax=Rhodothermus marinus (strain ATCC 43812 / DSM 4252 / R-10) TaxID=518766 RepID=D0MKN5_RHOM4|nr:TIGR02221 family CRISPR-associated protein [Rhodothermus marinus]ACY49699.1 CRISPR-associated protein, TM1812 family [Rhodothermus marinus DSM 4252]AEN74754.1 CRISPR-associated protein, TM1812 family [Rhodothermus marinus SG0.5JP17-172]
MERVLLSFIGTGNYQPCIYVWGDHRCKTPYFQEAAVRFFNPDQCLVLMTEMAQKKHGAALRRRIKRIVYQRSKKARAACNSKNALRKRIKRIVYRPVSIPDGRNEDELWAIFSALTDCIPEGATLIVDVTHGFRTQPMLALAALCYLRVARNVQIERIIYGAFEARHPDTSEAPVFDLTPFLTLIDWSVAAHQFIHYGQANDLARLIREIHRLTYVEQAQVQAQHAATAASWLEGFARALGLVRLAEVMTEHALRLPEALERMRQDVDQIARLRPFGLLLDITAERARSLHHPDPLSLDGLRLQAELIRHLLNYGLVQQAVTVAREAIVTRYALDLGRDPLQEREAVEHELGRLASGLQDPAVRAGYTPETHQLAELWNRLTNVRNDINHAGMRTNPETTNNLYRLASECAEAAANWIARDAHQPE